MPDRGTVLGGRYTLVELLGSGAMGEVWQAEDQVLERQVAVKIVLPALLADAVFAARFRREARLLALLSHRNVVRIHDYGEQENGQGGQLAYIVMELLDGRPLDRVLEQVRSAGATLPVGEALDITAQALDAVHAAHRQGIVHRDIKPSNLMLGTDGHVTMTDFGIARTVTGTRLTAADAVIGTALYLAPERAEGRDATAASDLYSVGVVCYELLTGEPPFTGDTVMDVVLKHVREPVPELPAHLPEPVRALVARALAKQPEERFADAAEMAAVVRAARAGGVAGAAVGSPDGSAGGGRDGGADPAGQPVGSALMTMPTLTLGPVRRAADAGAWAGVEGTPSGADEARADKAAAAGALAGGASAAGAAGAVGRIADADSGAGGAGGAAGAAGTGAAGQAGGGDAAGGLPEAVGQADAGEPAAVVKAGAAAQPAPGGEAAAAATAAVEPRGRVRRRTVVALVVPFVVVTGVATSYLRTDLLPWQKQADGRAATAVGSAPSGAGTAQPGAGAGGSVSPGAVQPGSESAVPSGGAPTPDGQADAGQGAGVPAGGGVAGGAAAGGAAAGGGGGGATGGGTRAGGSAGTGTGAGTSAGAAAGGAAAGGGGGNAGGGGTKPTAPATSGPPAGCGGAGWGAITNVGDGLKIGLAEDSPSAGVALVMGGHTQYGWVKSMIGSNLSLYPCSTSYPQVGAQYNANPVVVEVAYAYRDAAAWALEDAGSGRYYIKFGYGPNSCLTDNGSGHQLTASTCIPGSATQIWRLP